MIPILYESNETQFESNGLGRLRDTISAVVPEERNGLYELDIQYPVTGANYEKIQIGRIVGVTHDETGDIQPFDIVSYTRPINGIVTFHCVHISYRQSYITAICGNVQNLSQAFTAIKHATTPADNPFTYSTDINGEGYFPLSDGIPHTVKQMLGGTEGSILDTYGGEYEWDKFNVILHSQRGQHRNLTIRYGVNMTEYNEELDATETYMSCIPYWTDGTSVINGDVQTVGETITNRGECVPLNVSDKFEEKPTKAEVEAMGLAVLTANNPNIPTQNIHVEFARLQDLGYEGLENLYKCSLCDTINVEFPLYNTTGKFKIVKTTWDVLEDRYESMELGDLATTLSEALGIDTSLVPNQAEALKAELLFVNINDSGAQGSLTAYKIGPLVFVTGIIHPTMTGLSLILASIPDAPSAIAVNAQIGGYSNSSQELYMNANDANIYFSTTAMADLKVNFCYITAA